MTKHTPGPWRIQRGPMEDGWPVRGSTNRRVALVPGLRPYRKHEPHHAADARLIAAAPKLLEALEDAVRPDNRRHHWLKRARAAIAQATGVSDEKADS